MKKQCLADNLFVTAVIALGAISPSGAVWASGTDVEVPNSKAIYGYDDRMDLYQVTDSRLHKSADATVALIPSSRLSLSNNGLTTQIQTVDYATKNNLCPSEAFTGQRVAADCSGSLVGPDLVLTAGHCISKGAECDSTSIVFGFAVKKKGEMPGQVPTSEVYQCLEVVAHKLEHSGSDYALVRLNRKVENHVPLEMSETDVEEGTELYVIGHPKGLPTKVTPGGVVRSTVNPSYFVTTLDAYSGNSGSAVLNATTHKVEGILVRGERDFVTSSVPGQSCRVSNVCTEDGCRGEDVTRISEVYEAVMQNLISVKVLSAKATFMDMDVTQGEAIVRVEVQNIGTRVLPDGINAVVLKNGREVSKWVKIGKLHPTLLTSAGLFVDGLDPMELLGPGSQVSVEVRIGSTLLASADLLVRSKNPAVDVLDYYDELVNGRGFVPETIDRRVRIEELEDAFALENRDEVLNASGRMENLYQVAPEQMLLGRLAAIRRSRIQTPEGRAHYRDLGRNRLGPDGKLLKGGFLFIKGKKRKAYDRLIKQLTR